MLCQLRWRMHSLSFSSYAFPVDHRSIFRVYVCYMRLFLSYTSQFVYESAIIYTYVLGNLSLRCYSIYLYVLSDSSLSHLLKLTSDGSL